MYGIDWDGPCPSPQWDGDICEDTEAVDVPDTVCPLTDQDLLELHSAFDPLQDLDYHGVDIYMGVISFLEQKST